MLVQAFIVQNMTGKISIQQFAWVTVAHDTDSCLQALVLAKSLRKVVTFAEIAVVAVRTLSPELRLILSDHFDFLIEVDAPGEPFNLSLKEYGKLHSWSLTHYHKCIVLESSTLIVKNCDELFDTDGISIEHTSHHNNDCLHYLHSFLFVVKPCYKTFCRIRNTFFTEITEIKTRREGLKVPNALFSNYETTNLGLPLATNSSAFEAKLWHLEYSKPWETLLESCWTSLNTNGNNVIRTLWTSLLDQEVLPTFDLQTMYAFGLGEWKKIHNMPENPLTRMWTKEGHMEIKDTIAIVGQSCRFPAADNSDEFWDQLKNGKHGITTINLNRLPEWQASDKRYNTIKAGFLKCPIDEFDAKFFEVSPREASFMDPQQRLMVEVAWEALENAGIDPKSLKGTNTAVFSGLWMREYEKIVSQNFKSEDFMRLILGNHFSATSARISFFLGLNGPNVMTESGCSSSMVGLHLACDSLKKRETNLAIIAGANLLVHHFPHSEVPVLAKDGLCKTYDERADGFSRAEGVSVFVVKRFRDAIRDGDRILSVIRGSGISNEGTSSSFGTPSKICQEIAIKQAFKSSGVRPEEVDYVEAHGTGTPIGDPIEFAAISAGYKGETPRDHPLIVGSVKTNTGHTESAAGLAGITKVLLAMENEMIPPHLHFRKINPSIELEALPATIATVPTPWCTKGGRKRIAGVSSFGISGTNVHVILEEPPAVQKNYTESISFERTYQLLTLSTKSETALKDMARKYVELIQKHGDTATLADICFSANTGRAHMRHRLALIAKDNLEMKRKLEAAPLNNNELQGERPKIAFLFTGQGSQYFGMAKCLYDSSWVFRDAFNACSSYLQNNLQISLKKVMWEEAENENTLNESIYSQTCIFSVAFALLTLWKSFGVRPDYVIGHSAGEFAASVAAGVMSLEEALNLVTERSRLINSLPKGAMLAVSADRPKIDNILNNFTRENPNEWVDVAVINSAIDIVLAGKGPTLEKLRILFKEENIKCTLLAATHAFHSRDMENILEPFGNVCNQIEYKEPEVIYVSGSTGKELSKNDVNAHYWQNHARNTVDFTMGIKTLWEQGCNTFIEIGAQPVLLSLVMNNVSFNEDSTRDCLWLPSIRKNEDNWLTILTSLSKLYSSGYDVDWKQFDVHYNRKKLVLPNYPFQRQKYWIQYTGEEITKTINPLLGRKVSLAMSKNDHIYQHFWDLRDLSYFRDHQVSNLVLLPGAVYMELFLSAGKDIFPHLQNGTEVVVENFSIEAPMELEDTGNKIQVVATVENQEINSNKFSIRAFKYTNLNGYNEEKGWKMYASATVSTKQITAVCVNSVEDSYWVKNRKSRQESPEEEPVVFGYENLNNIRKRCCEEIAEISSTAYYKRCVEVGFMMGRRFQTMGKILVGKREILVEIAAPADGGDMSDFAGHPLLLDAMVQSVSVSIIEMGVDLYLPVMIEKGIIFANKVCDTYFAHMMWEEGKAEGSVCLYDDKSNLLAVLQSVRLVRSTISSFMNIISAQKNKLPGLYKEVWRVQEGPSVARLDFSKMDSSQILKNLQNNLKGDIDKYSTAIGDLKIVNRYCWLSILKSFIQLGWRRVPGTLFDEESFLNDLAIAPVHFLYVKMLLGILVEENLLDFEGENDSGGGQWRILGENPTDEEVFELTRECERELECSAHWSVEKKLLINSSNHLSAILEGKEFQNGQDLYGCGLDFEIANKRIGEYISGICQTIETGDNVANYVLNILEISAGAGSSTTKHIISALERHKILFRYTVTSSSAESLKETEKQFSGIKGIDYKILNVELDSKIQGFIPRKYDIVVVSNVFYQTESLKQSIGNVRQLLSPQNGILIVQELMAKSRLHDVILGLDRNFWRFKDLDIRENHPNISEEMWVGILAESGFESIKNISDKREICKILIAENNSSYICNNYSLTSGTYKNSDVKENIWVIFGDNLGFAPVLQRNIENLGDKVVILGEYETFKNSYFTLKEIEHVKCTNNILGFIFLNTLNEDTVQENFCKTIFEIIKSCIKEENVPKFLVATRGVHHSGGDQGIVDPSKATVWGLLKTAQNERPDLVGKMIDFDPDNINIAKYCEQLLFELWNLTGESQIMYRNGKRHYLRLISLGNQTTPLTLPNDRYSIVIPASKSIKGITFRSAGKPTLKPKELDVEVKAFALNFRDIFVILKPEMFNSKYETVGSDVAGIVREVGCEVTNFKVGDEVVGMSFASSAGSHVTLEEHHLMLKPKSMTFPEASTLPSVFLTAYRCVISVAKLRENETILIHVASGGVGLLAIQIANRIGAKIIATAGSKRKRNYLRALGLKHVFHSRDTSFGEAIDKVTDGRGVDVVLNSLTGPNFKETSLRVTAHGGRFIEIGKINIWQPSDVAELRPDVNYAIFDLEHTFDLIGEDLLDTIKPLPYTMFPITQIQDAFNYFLKAQHVGKIVITSSEVVEASGKHFRNDLIFNSESTYMVTGGHGAIGLEVAKWMSQSGAKNILLVGRSSPGENARKIINSISAKGCKIISHCADIGNWKDCEQLFGQIGKEMPPLRGVIHSAGTISDGMITNLTWETFQTVFQSKVQGAWNLHEFTKNIPLEHFVLFSSMTALWCPMGQSNYAAANMYLDSLAHYRHSLGLPAHTIDWGAWSEIGLATKTVHGAEGAFGVRPHTPAQGIAALKYIMCQPNTQVGVVQFDPVIFRESFSSALEYTEELVATDQTSIQSSAQAELFWADLENLTCEIKRGAYIKKWIASAVRQTMRLPETENIDETQTFSEMGLDSLMAVELRNKLQQIFGKRIKLNPTSLLDYPTLATLGKYLAGLTMSATSSPSGENNSENSDDRLNLIQTDSILPAFVIPGGTTVRPSVIPSETKKVFLTGVTGHVGVYILRELLGKQQDIEVVCLIRAKSQVFAMKRLVENLKKFNLYSGINLTKNVSVVVGDISKEKLGIDPETYEKMALEVDAIFHCAVKANHIEPYKVTKSNFDIRSVNVLGTIRILELASYGKTKRVAYCSSYACANRLTDEGTISEEFPNLENNADGIASGYCISKFVCEKLIGQAVQRGIPCTVFRYPTLIGNSQTGLFTLDTNFMMNFFIAICRAGVVCDFPGGWCMLPVDIATEISVSIFLNDNAPPSTLYNIIQNKPMYSENIVSAVATALRKKIKLVDDETFDEVIGAGDDPLLSVFKEAAVGGNKGYRHSMLGSIPAFQLALEKSNGCFFKASEKLIEALRGSEVKVEDPTNYVIRQIMFARESGILKKLQLE